MDIKKTCTKWQNKDLLLRISIKQSAAVNMEKKDLSEYKMFLTKQHNANIYWLFQAKADADKLERAWKRVIKMIRRLKIWFRMKG